MRDLRCDQLPLSAAPDEEEHIGARQLAEIDRALVQLPDDEAIAMVYSDLAGPGARSRKAAKA